MRNVTILNNMLCCCKLFHCLILYLSPKQNTTTDALPAEHISLTVAISVVAWLTAHKIPIQGEWSLVSPYHCTGLFHWWLGLKCIKYMMQTTGYGSEQNGTINRNACGTCRAWSTVGQSHSVF